MANSVTVNGVTYTDDANATTGLANGGHRVRLIPMFSNAIIDLGAKKDAAAASATSATTQATNAANSAAAAAADAAASAASAQALSATSTTSLTPSLVEKIITTQSGKDFPAGTFVMLVSASDSAVWMYGPVTSYSGTTLTFTPSVVGTATDKADWNISGRVGARGATGPAGPTFTGGSLTSAINTARATVASAATTADIWGAAGNQIDWTGTVTCTGFPAAPQAGAERVLICAAAAPFTAGANMLIDGVASGGTVTCAVNDQVIVRAVSTTQFKLSRVRYDGAAGLGANTFTDQQTINADVFISGGNRLRGSYGLGAVVTNLAVGDFTLYYNTTGYQNAAVGNYALYYNTTGYQNAAVGNSPLYYNTTGYQNAAVGNSPLYYNTTGYQNAAVGNSPLYYNTTGNQNAAVGNYALYYNTTGYQNAAVGNYALYYNTTGYQNAAVGNFALSVNRVGYANSAFGNYALSNLGATQTAGAFNVGTYYVIVTIGTTDFTLIGASSNTVGVGFTATGVGSGTGTANPTPRNNTGIGNYAGTDAVANLIYQSNYVVLGNDSTANANIKVAWTVTSDARDKMDFAPVPHGLDFVNRLKPTKYIYRKSREEDVPQVDARPRYGFLAQDVLPLEGGNTVIVDDRDADNLKFNDQSLLAVMANAIRELSEKVDAQALEIAAIKGEK